ncbi:hypothetical protein BMF94_0823 [Rhodotorula taiwanensis]|uniref:Uncharacterized protein n=1 Tax=Rhodotorula taiwanensis TaxID=741276 RepID=A0A2S5BH53_9BASI|nr:hypothetical protein BMF94_0823 [Rhodotorula taiwanensis]
MTRLWEYARLLFLQLTPTSAEMKFLFFGALVAGLPNALAAAEAGSGPGVDAQQSRSDVSKDLSEVTEWKELCYVDLYAAAATSTLKYTKEVLSKDASGRDIFISDGYKKDSEGKDFYYLETCYRSGSTQGSTRTSKDASSGATELNPFVSIVDALDIGGTSGDLLSGLASGFPLVFGNDGGALFKRQNGSSTGQDDSALADLNRVSQAIGGPDNVLDLNDSGSGTSPSSDPTETRPAGGNSGGALGSTDAGNVWDQSDGFDGALEGLDRFGANPFARPSPTTTTSQGPRILRLSTIDVQTSILHSDSRQTSTMAAQPEQPFFASASSVFVPGTPSLGSEAPTAPPSGSGTPGAVAPSTTPLTVGIVTATQPASSLFISVGGGGQVTGSVTTIATPTPSVRAT